MSNNIFTKQNEHDILCLLKAQHDAYSEAKKYLYRPLVFSITMTIIFLIAIEVCTNPIINNYLKAFSSFFAIIALFSMTYCETKSKELKEIGARIQQSIDLRLFDFPSLSNSLTQSETIEIIAKYLDTDLSDFKDWYHDYSKLPFQEQIFCSQKENIRWDLKLRQKYHLLLYVILIITPTLLIIYFIIVKSTILDVLAIAAWLFPLAQSLFLQKANLDNDITSLRKVGHEFEDIEKNFYDYGKTELDCKLCTLQGYIFENRKNSVLIPNWFYKLLKTQMQKNEKNIARVTSGQ